MDIGEVYFYTSTIIKWKHLLKKDSYKTIIIDSLKVLVERKLLIVYGFVIMRNAAQPNHIHIIWELLAMNGKEMPDTSFTKFTAQQFRKELSINYPQILEMFRSDKNDRSYQFWQRDPLATRIFSKEMLLQKLEYMHTNPMQERWNLVESPEKYHWSSAKFYENQIDNFGFITHFMDKF